jgi:hypothetical protein
MARRRLGANSGLSAAQQNQRPYMDQAFGKRRAVSLLHLRNLLRSPGGLKILLGGRAIKRSANLFDYIAAAQVT